MQIATRQYRFLGFVLDMAARELRQDEALVALPARSFDCLAYLIEHRDRAVGRDELIAAVWGRAEVSDDLLGHTVLKVRRVLGDTGSDQRAIRTVPRFGYRWIAEIERVESAPRTGAAEPESAIASSALLDEHVNAPPAVRATAVPSRVPRMAWAALALSVLLLTLSGGRWLESRHAPQHTIAALAMPDEDLMPVSALVLPAEVMAEGEWQWLRLGAMDLIANRLRSSALHTLPSDNVLAILNARAADADPELLHAQDLAGLASLRVRPSLRREGRSWLVRLDVFGPQTDFLIEARGSDAIASARAAADQMLHRLGRRPDESDQQGVSAELDDLLQRSGAAMLADRLDEGRQVLLQAPLDLLSHPRIQHRLGQLDLRSGAYDAVAKRMSALLPALSPERDSALRARVLITLASAYMRQGLSEHAVPAYEEAIALRETHGDGEALGIARLGRGLILANESKFAEATAELSRARIDLETVGDAMGIAAVDVNLGNFQLLQRHPAQALMMLRSAAKQFQRLGAREGLAHARMTEIIAQRDLLEPEAALLTSEQLWPPSAHTSNRQIALSLTRARAEVLIDLGRLDQAEALIAEVHTLSSAPDHALLRAQNHATAARLAWLRSDAQRAGIEAAQALTPALRSDDTLQYLRTTLLQARAARALGEPAKAAAALSGLDLPDERAVLAGQLIYQRLGVAEQLWAARRAAEALEQFAQAMQAVERLNAPEELVMVAAPYLAALIESKQFDRAREVSGRIAPWADRDLRAADAQARLYRALGEHASARKAAETTQRLSGRLPTQQ